jgi:hypothetical protein
MNRDETVELFLKGREAWNAWANALLAERKAMEDADTWKSRRDFRWEPEIGDTPETQAWLDKASVSFSRCLFLVRGVEGTKETAGESKKEDEEHEPPVKSIQLEVGGTIDFSGFVFPGDTNFGSATFSGYAYFGSATFSGYADFRSATFSGNAYFESATFNGNATFALANFRQHATFAASRFEAEASFNAISGERGFDMAHAVFEAVPDFIQAHFAEAPRLDNLKVHGRWMKRHARPASQEAEEPQAGELAEEPEEDTCEPKWRARWQAVQRRARRSVATGWRAVRREGRYLGGRLRTKPARVAKGAWRRLWEDHADLPASWRALKRLAIQGHDSERELEFHARELQSQRLETDWPHPPLLFWRAPAWVGFLRFWFGFLYGLLSDFGRSIFRPFVLWWLTIAVFAMYFLAGQPDVAPRWQAGAGQGAGASVAAYVRLVPQLWREPPACFKGDPLPEKAKLEPGKRYGLDERMAETTNALTEAFRLAIRNGSIFLDGGDDSARRTYGCLYGIQSFGGSPAPFVPGFVTDAAGLQKVLSALYLFLFGLALRNMLKMK